MERIASFQVDHNKLKKGMYISRVDFNDIYTYDIRMKLPNGGDYLTTGSLHSMEHIFANFARNSKWKDSIIYIGPMGCRTGFYLITKGMPHSEAISLVQESMDFIRNFTGDIPGASAVECGNYLDQDLPLARAIADDMCKQLAGCTEEKLIYEV